MDGQLACGTHYDIVLMAERKSGPFFCQIQSITAVMIGMRNTGKRYTMEQAWE
jgi:hypothetical protein